MENINNNRKKIEIPVKDLTETEFNEKFVNAIRSMGFIINELESGWTNIYYCKNFKMDYSIDDLFITVYDKNTNDIIFESDIMVSSKYLQGMISRIGSMLGLI
jgi:uncharacterized FlaG/YvyC family protein